MRTNSISRRADAESSHESGFTLFELLIVIAIVIMLATLSMVAVNRMRFGAAKATTMNQMRQIAVAVTSWATENNNGEPFYVANGTGDYCDESNPGPNSSLSPGNPAKLLYNTKDPGTGYCADYQLFFSPLVKIVPPVRDKYKPETAAPGVPWGAYVWYFPFSTNMTQRQRNASGQWLDPARVAPNLQGKLMMMTDYSRGDAKWEKYYIAVMVDGSVRKLENEEVYVRPMQ